MSAPHKKQSQENTKESQKEREKVGEFYIPSGENIDFYQKKYKKIVEAENFYFQGHLDTYELLKSYEQTNRSSKNSIFASLKYWFDKLKTSDADEVFDVIIDKEPNLVDALNLIKQVADDIVSFHSFMNENLRIPITWESFEIAPIEEVLDYCMRGFVFEQGKNLLLKEYLDYLNKPSSIFPIFSYSDLKNISLFFIKKELREEEYHIALLARFQQLGFIVKNNENSTLFYSKVIYDHTVKKLWDPAYRPKGKEGEFKSTNQTDTIPFHLDYIEEIDRLNREPIAKSIARLLNNQIFKDKKLRHSFMIHLQGAWGDGKSTFLRLLSKHLKGVDENDKPAPEKESKWIVVDFNAWRHQHIEQPWWIFMDAIYKQIQKSKGHKFGIWWKERWWRLITLNSMYWLSFMALLLLFLIVNYFSGFNSLNLKVLLGNAESGGKILSVITSYISIIGSAWFFIKAISGSLIPASSQAAAEFKKNVRDPMAVLKKHFEKVIGYVKDEKNVAVFIDDLDRCNAEFTVGLLEGIQTLFKEQAVLYVVAGDRHWISTCFENHYEKYKDVAREPAQRLGHLFLEKAFQLSIRLPKISGNTKKSYWDFILNPAKKENRDETKLEKEQKQELKQSIGQSYNSADLIKPENMEKIVEEHNINIEQATDLVLEVMDENQEDIKHMLQQHYPLIDPNPRGVKRLANQYTVYRNILTAEGRDFEREKLFRWLILQNKYPVYTDWLETHLDEYSSGENTPKDLKEIEKDEKWKELFFQENDKTKRVLAADDIAVFTGMISEKSINIK